MPIVNYQYLSDAGNLYQLSLPSDFPAALGMIVAVGNEPYLDAAITPRTATYVSATGQIRNTVIGTPRMFGTLPVLLNVGGVVFTLSNAIGQQTNAFFPANLVSASGPMGPPGPAGPQGPAGFLSAAKELYTHNDNFTFSANNTGQDIGPDWTCLVSGTYLVIAWAEVIGQGGPNDNYALFIVNYTDTIYLATGECANADVKKQSLVAMTITNLVAGKVYTRLALGNQAGGGNFSIGNFSNVIPIQGNSGFMALQLA
jgi:hypothetical protein